MTATGAVKFIKYHGLDMGVGYNEEGANILAFKKNWFDFWEEIKIMNL